MGASLSSTSSINDGAIWLGALACVASSTATAAVFLSLNPSAASSPSANTRRGIVLGSFATLSSLSFVCGFARQQLRREQERISLAETNSLLSRCPSQARLREVDLSTREGFLDLFEELCEELAQDAHRYRLPVDASMHLKKLIQYNVPGGKLNRGLTVVHTARTVLGEGVTYAEMKRIAVLGWCIEWVQASFLVADDIMDASLTRRGKPCWYKREDIGVVAINDALLLLTQVEILLRRYYGTSKMFMPLHATIVETIYQTELGQLLDLTTQPPGGKVDLNQYTEERYDMIVKHKTAFYSFYCPIALGLLASGICDEDSLSIARSICIKMGTYFQIQDDYLDCYGDPEVIGKVGTDIQDSKCGWLVVQALKMANKEQRRVIEDNYGKDSPECIERVKQVYNELSLENHFRDYEEKSYVEIRAEIEAIDESHVPRKVFVDLLEKIYKRKK